MQLVLNSKILEREKRVNPKKVVLVERDFELIEFLLDMKFASVDEVFRKFFKVISEGEAKNDLWAKKRLYQLEKANFVKSVKSFSENTKFYCGTFKGYYAVSNFKPHMVIARPLPSIDQRTFIHDKTALLSRLHLEETNKVTNWLSDRKLKSSTELSGGLSTVYIPDALYLSSEGQKVAFEVEIAVKAKARYQDKIRKYVQLMRSNDSKVKIFDRVHFVCAKDSVVQHLLKETKIYGDLFKVESMNSFFGKDV